MVDIHITVMDMVDMGMDTDMGIMGMDTGTLIIKICMNMLWTQINPS